MKMPRMRSPVIKISAERELKVKDIVVHMEKKIMSKLLDNLSSMKVPRLNLNRFYKIRIFMSHGNTLKLSVFIPKRKLT